MNFSKKCRVVKDWFNIFKNKKWVQMDNVSIGKTNQLINLLSHISKDKIDQVDNLTKAYSFINKGLYFLHCNDPMVEIDNDGYSNKIAPTYFDGTPLFLRRMWTGGKLEFFFPTKKINYYIFKCEEKIKKVRCVDENVFITTERNFYVDNLIIIRETRSIIYTDNFYHEKESFVIVPEPSDKDTIWSLTSNHLLIYSYLTLNFHKIHYDVMSAKKEGLSDTIVHGPFTITIILLEFYKRYPEKKIKYIKYENRAPIYSNTKFSISFKSKKNQLDVFLYSFNNNHVYVSATIIND